MPILPTNKLMNFLALFCCSGALLLLFLFPLTSKAAFTKQINYQGKLTNSAGSAVSDASYTIVFTLYDALTGGNVVWTETDTVTTQDGLFSLMLGSVSSLDNVNFNQPLYLTLNVNGDGEMTPRKTLGAVASSFTSARLDGNASSTAIDVSGYLVVNGNATTTGYLNIGSAPTGANFSSGNLNLQNNLVVGGGITLGGVYRNSWPSGGSGTDVNWSYNPLTDILTTATSTSGITVFGTSTFATTTNDLVLIGDTDAIIADPTVPIYYPTGLDLVVGGKVGIQSEIGAADWGESGGLAIAVGALNATTNVNASSSSSTAYSIFIGNGLNTSFKSNLGSDITISNSITATVNSGVTVNTGALGLLENLRADFQNNGTITGNAANLYLNNTNNGTISGSYFGMYISDVAGYGSTDSYSIYTGGGKHYFGGDTSINGNATTTGYLTVGSAPTGSNFSDGNLNVQNNFVVGGGITFGGVYRTTWPDSFSTTSADYWGNEKGYLTVETDPVWTAASTSYAKLSLDNIFTGSNSFYNNISLLGNSLDPELKFFNSDSSASSSIKYSTSTDQFSVFSRLNLLQSNSITLEKDFSSLVQDSPRIMEVSGNRLYVLTYGSTTEVNLKIFNISNPTYPIALNSGSIDNMPTLVSTTGGGGKSLAIRGRYLYMTTSTATNTDVFRIIDVQQPKNPVVVGGQNLDIPDDSCASVDVTDNYAYLACGSLTGVIFVVDVRDPYNPRLVKEINYTVSVNSPWVLKISGDYFYLGGRNSVDTSQHFKVFDIHDRENPVEVAGSGLSFEGIWSIDIQGSYAYIGAGGSFVSSAEHKLRIVDISDPLNPTDVSSLYLNDMPINYVRIYGKYLFALGWGNKLYMIDVSSSTAPVILQEKLVGNYPLTLAAHDNYLYVGSANIPRDGVFLRVYNINGVNSLSGAFGVLTAGDMYIQSDAVIDKTLSVYHDLSVGGSIFTTGNFYSVATSASSFLGSLGLGTTSPSHFLTVGSGSTTETAKSIQVPYGGICVDNDGWCDASTTGRVSAVSYTTGSSDLAENYQVFESGLEAGDIVAITNVNASNFPTNQNESYGLQKAKAGQTIIGVISTKPGITLGLDNDETINAGKKPVALSGRIPVKVNLEGGSILPGDYITVSSVSGIGMKATSSTEIVGYALESFDSSKLGANGYGQVMVFINLGYARLSPQITSGAINSSGPWSLDEGTGQIKIFASLNLNNLDLINVRSITSASGNWSIDEGGMLKVRSLEISDSLKIGSPEKRIGFTLYDEQTGEPYCISIAGGAIKNTPGECSLVANNPSSGGVINPPTGGELPGGQVAGTSTEQESSQTATSTESTPDPATASPEPGPVAEVLTESLPAITEPQTAPTPEVMSDSPTTSD